MSYKISKINNSVGEVLQKMRNLCAYQERSQEEIRIKIRDYNLDKESAEEIIANLISENYLNEERFVDAFCSGKFKIKNWGKYKIKVELRRHKIPEAMISRALESIDENEYIQVLRKVITKRIALQKKEIQYLVQDTLRYCISKGFEHELALQHIKDILKVKSID